MEGGVLTNVSRRRWWRRRRRSSETSVQSFEVLSSSVSSSESKPPVALAPWLPSTGTTKETFTSFVELLVSAVLDEDVIAALEKVDGEGLLPCEPQQGPTLTGRV